MIIATYNGFIFITIVYATACSFVFITSEVIGQIVLKVGYYIDEGIFRIFQLAAWLI